MFPILTPLAPMVNILVLVSDPFLCAPYRLFHGFISHLSNHEKILLSSLESSASATLTRDITWQQPAMGRACRQSTSETSAHATLDRDMAWSQAVTAIDSSSHWRSGCGQLAKLCQNVITSRVTNVFVCARGYSEVKVWLLSCTDFIVIIK